MTTALTDEARGAAVRASLDELGADAGPKAIHNRCKGQDSRYDDISLMKMKRLIQAEKKVLDERAAKEKALLMKLKKREGTKTNCPMEHGLTLHKTTHGGYCCDVCRCYVRLGDEMRGCRICDWDVCIKCSGPIITIEDLTHRFNQINDIVNEGFNKTKYAQAETDLHKLEKQVDSLTAKDLQDNAPIVMTVDEAKQRIFRTMHRL